MILVADPLYRCSGQTEKITAADLGRRLVIERTGQLPATRVKP